MGHPVAMQKDGGRRRLDSCSPKFMTLLLLSRDSCPVCHLGQSRLTHHCHRTISAINRACTEAEGAALVARSLATSGGVHDFESGRTAGTRSSRTSQSPLVVGISDSRRRRTGAGDGDHHAGETAVLAHFRDSAGSGNDIWSGCA